jgi:hypothetical protein
VRVVFRSAGASGNATAIDSGDGDWTQKVYDFAFPRAAHRVMAVKGLGGARARHRGQQGKNEGWWPPPKLSMAVQVATSSIHHAHPGANWWQESKERAYAGRARSRKRRLQQSPSTLILVMCSFNELSLGLLPVCVVNKQNDFCRL